MLVELGNASPIGEGTPDGKPGITYLRIPEDYSFKRDVNTEEWRNHLAHSVLRRGGMVVDAYEGGEVLCQLTHPNGVTPAHQSEDPTWVWSDDPDAARFLNEYYQAPIMAADLGNLGAGHHPDIDETHWRKGPRGLLAPGVSRNAVIQLDGLLTNVGATMLSDVFGGGALGLVPSQAYAKTGVGTAAGASSFTVASGLTASAWIGATIWAGDTTTGDVVWANVISNTSTVFTIDQWYTTAGAIGTTPVAGFQYYVAFTIQPAWFMGLTTSVITPNATDTSLSGESTATGMARKASVYGTSSAVSGGSIAWTNSASFTYGTSGALTFTALAMFDSLLKSDTTDTMVFETNLVGSFTVSTNGDIATVTDTITGS